MRRTSPQFPTPLALLFHSFMGCISPSSSFRFICTSPKPIRRFANPLHHPPCFPFNCAPPHPSSSWQNFLVTHLPPRVQPVKFSPLSLDTRVTPYLLSFWLVLGRSIKAGFDGACSAIGFFFLFRRGSLYVFPPMQSAPVSPFFLPPN